MKVFLSWSGERSRAIADAMRRWFPSVLQAVRPYFSPDDVAKGARWSTEIAKELEASRIGLLIITPENQEAPWLLFEAGALAKNLDRSKVCPILFGAMEPTDVKGPLVQFQAAQFSKDEMRRVAKMMNDELGESKLAPDVLENVFEMWWPKLEEQIKKELAATNGVDHTSRRADRDMLEEVLALTRDLARDRERRFDFEHPVWDDLLARTVELARIARARSVDEETSKVIRRVLEPMHYIMRKEMKGGMRRSAPLRHMVMELEEMLAQELKPKASLDGAAGKSTGLEN